MEEDELEIFNKIKIGIASDEKIREWSKGEVKKPETINQVGVRVAERRKEHAPCRVDDLVGGDVAQRVHASERRETAVFGQQPRVVERAQLVHVGAAAAQTARRFDADDAGDVLHQQSHRPRRNRTEASIWGYITSSLSMKGTSLR